MGTQDPFDFIASDVSITADDCSSSCVSSFDDASSSVSTVQHSNTGTGRVKPSLSTNTTAGRAQPPPSSSGVGRVHASFDLSLHPKLSQVSKPTEYTHLRTIMINSCMISPGFRKKFTYEPNTVFCALVDTGAWVLLLVIKN